MNDLTLNERQLATLKNTTAKSLNSGEFNLFIEYCRNVGLDPIRKQVVPILFSASDPAKRQMTIVVTIDGLRVIAARAGGYRADDHAPVIVYRDDLKNPDTNPLGIEKAVVRVFKQDNRGDWYPVVAEAYWDEFAPIKQWGDQPAKLDSKTLWPAKPRVMICKCAEAQALRKGWPDQFAGIYADSEFDQAQAIDGDASEVVEGLSSAPMCSAARIGLASLRPLSVRHPLSPSRLNKPPFQTFRPRRHN